MRVSFWSAPDVLCWQISMTIVKKNCAFIKLGGYGNRSFWKICYCGRIFPKWHPLGVLWGFCFVFVGLQYLHVGCTMQNEEYHSAFCLLYPNLKLVIGCNIFLKIAVKVTREDLSTLMCWHQCWCVENNVTFDTRLALTGQTKWFIGFLDLFLEFLFWMEKFTLLLLVQSVVMKSNMCHEGRTCQKIPLHPSTGKWSSNFNF